MALLLALNFVGFLLALLFGAGVSAAIRKSRRSRIIVPPAGASLRIRAEEAVYRSRFLGQVPEGWEFAAPLQRDVFVPIRVGEALTIEAEWDDQRVIFRSTLIQRSGETGHMVVARPDRVYRNPKPALTPEPDPGETKTAPIIR